jgi:hypothetical protein
MRPHRSPVDACGGVPYNREVVEKRKHVGYADPFAIDGNGRVPREGTTSVKKGAI